VNSKEPYLIWSEPDPSKIGTPTVIGRARLKKIIGWATAATLFLILMPPTPALMPLLWFVAVATGYGAAVLIAVLMLLPLRTLLLSPSGRISVPMHERIALWCLGLSCLHVAVFLVAEPMTIEYLKWSQPRHMIAGNTGFIILALIVVTSLTWFRTRLFGVHFRFRPVHVIASLLLVVLTSAHMLGSAIYLTGRLKFAIFAIICAALAALSLRRPKPLDARNAQERIERS
jgi:DMSO/TMAO reductase YedYZ heme-binding membrane subunit